MNYSAFDFPVLQPDGGDFDDSVKYIVGAETNKKDIWITHTLTGQSFLRDCLLAGKAAFMVQVLYKDSSERQAHKVKIQLTKNSDSLVCNQQVAIDFSYPPKITPCIVALEDFNIDLCKPKIGLSDLWVSESTEILTVEALSRIAHHIPLDFIDGTIQNLINVELDEKLDAGEMSVVLNENARENEIPVTLRCGDAVYRELKKPMARDISNIKTYEAALPSAIITHALSVVYEKMHKKLADIEVGYDEDINETLRAHLDEMAEKTGFQLEDENFDACLAATKMRPYAIWDIAQDEDE